MNRRQLLAGAALLGLGLSAQPVPARPADAVPRDPIPALLRLVIGLEDRGWGPTFEAHGVRLSAQDVASIVQPLTRIDRRRPGFEDFAGSGVRLIEPGDPGRSLLYHALASPDVRPDGLDRAAYPTLTELDVVENAIYALAPPTEADLADLTPAVFAYQYRSATHTPHGQHADMVFSRMAIGRLGSAAMQYDPEMRSFNPVAADPRDVRVLPARFGVFLARRGGGVRAARQSVFADAADALVPVHKLYDGLTTGSARSLSIRFNECHVNDKLAKGLRQGLSVRDVHPEEAPFTTRSRDGAGFAAMERVGATVLLSSRPAPLVRPARRPDGDIVTTRVRPQTRISRINRRYTSWHLYDNLPQLMWEGGGALLRVWLGAENPAPGDYPNPRNGPEFVNIRHTVASPNHIVDMRTQPRDRDAFLRAVASGDRDAVLFEDGCAEGVVGAVISGFDRPIMAAYSVLTAPDFFPFADQLSLQRAIFPRRAVSRYFRQGGPDPLCFGNLPPNPTLVDPMSDRGAAAFDPADRSYVALVSAPPRGPAAARLRDRPAVGFLSDTASNVFAPGWDLTYARTDGVLHYTTSGLGSPFPEDAKLCAAANAMWPAVSPDASRTFARQKDTPTAIPLMDDELGIHPRHPSGRPARRGWDGEYGPFLTADGLSVDFADIERSDYVANLLEGGWDFHRLAGIDTFEMFERMEAYRRALALAGFGDITTTNHMLIAARAWEHIEEYPRAHAVGLTGRGYAFLMGEIGAADKSVPEVGRLTAPLRSELALCLMTSEGTAGPFSAPPGPGALALSP